MHPILLYVLKMLLCSGILYGYYRVALYNERFHQWNRFYLLASLMLSLIVPLIEIPLIAEEQSVGLVYIIEAFPAAVVTKAAPLFTTASIIWMIAILVSAIMLMRLIVGMFKTLYKPYREGEVTTLDDVSIIITEVQSAPYSFFKWLFWRSDMEPDSPHGKRVLEHELTHIRELHSVDKLVMECVLIACWFNPFLWLIKKELYVIHEFLADRKAIEHNDGAAFAEMILNTINSGYPSAVANPFFSSQLKRRFKMITTSNKAQYSYLRRISGLVAMVGISLLLMLTIEKGMAQSTPPPPPPPPVAPPPPTKVALPDSIKTIDVNTVDGKSIVTIRLKNGVVRKMPVDEAIKKGYPVPPPPPPAPPAPPSPPEASTKLSFGDGFEKGKEPLVIYAGLEITEEQLQQINPQMIESIDVLKGEKAIAAYGDKGKNGVIKITPKTQIYTQNPGIRNDPKEVVVIGYGPKAPIASTPVSAKIAIGYPLENPPLHVLNGKIISLTELEAIDPTTIVTVNILENQKAIDAYGEKGKYGVVEMETRKTPSSEESFDKIFTIAEKMPSFPGGGEGWTKHLQKNLRYPDKAIDGGIQGVAKISFLVNKMGNLSNFEIVQNPGSGLGEEALRVIKEGPNWEPAEQNGKMVSARVTQVVTFRLE